MNWTPWKHLSEFRMEARHSGLALRNRNGIAIEKRLVLPHGQNTAFINYSLVSGDDGVRLVLRPSIHFRPHETPVARNLESSYTLTVGEDRYEIFDRDRSAAAAASSWMDGMPR